MTSLTALGLSSLKGKGKILSLGLVGWMFLSTWMARPYFLPYFNEVIGGSANGYQYFSDSNVDWGQGLKELKDNLSEEDLQRGIFLSYFGVVDPHVYGIRYVNVGSDAIVPRRDDSGHADVHPVKFAISATNYQSTYYRDKELFSWLSSRKPEKVIGHSILLYDFSKDSDALRTLRVLSGWEQ